MDCTVVPACCVALAQGRGTQAEPAGVPDLGRWSWSPGRAGSSSSQSRARGQHSSREGTHTLSALLRADCTCARGDALRPQKGPHSGPQKRFKGATFLSSHRPVPTGMAGKTSQSPGGGGGGVLPP